MKTKWTNEVLKSFEPRKEGYDWYVKNCLEKGITDTANILNMLIKDGSSDCIEWANWTVARALDRKGRIKYAVFAAEQVIDIYEKKYPDDKRPRKAIEAAKKCIGDECAAYAATRAADAAFAAADAAYAAADAADAADAAYAATRAADAAAYAAYAAADAADAADAAYAADAADAAYAAKKKQMKIKILQYGIGLIKEFIDAER